MDSRLLFKFTNTVSIYENYNYGKIIKLQQINVYITKKSKHLILGGGVSLSFRGLLRQFNNQKNAPTRFKTIFVR